MTNNTNLFHNEEFEEFTIISKEVLAGNGTIDMVNRLNELIAVNEQLLVGRKIICYTCEDLRSGVCGDVNERDEFRDLFLDNMEIERAELNVREYRKLIAMIEESVN